jgi:hypothetical protein
MPQKAVVLTGFALMEQDKALELTNLLTFVQDMGNRRRSLLRPADGAGRAR